MTETAANPLVLVTGATGFIGQHVILQLLETGYRVRGTMRSL
ncbi:GDP-mannose 4,6-dehydratase [Fontisubflavum oceani]|nr:GDP-mannose 4,6-dehydratase [Fontisubflavum oceani]WJY21913.1 GDP-mannose 4,6-dehydratase [Fontisubflavum oceani]